MNKVSISIDVPDLNTAATFYVEALDCERLRVEGVPAAVSKVVAAGGTHEGGDSGTWGEIAYCADPFGNGFCLINE